MLSEEGTRLYIKYIIIQICVTLPVMDWIVLPQNSCPSGTTEGDFIWKQGL